MFITMKSKRFFSSNKLYTPTSQSTVYIDYSAAKKQLEVEFTGGKTYHYFGVEPKIWDEYKNTVLSGGSSGEYVNFIIKPNYAYEELIE